MTPKYLKKLNPLQDVKNVLKLLLFILFHLHVLTECGLYKQFQQEEKTECQKLLSEESLTSKLEMTQRLLL